jgi:8-oxo-dGTP pyrophosphatase MutT (NUDIX family)
MDERNKNSMQGIPVQESRLFEAIAKRAAHFSASTDSHAGNQTPAAVAMILHQGATDLEVLFIQRASHDMDPWSGHIAFPGGKLEGDEMPCQAACRETLEEIGINLRDGRYLGRLSDIIGTNLPVRVSCCLFGVDKNHVRPALNEEVRSLFWVPLSDLRDPQRHARSPVAFDDKTFDVPAIRLPVENTPVLWGITYRLVMQFLAILADDAVECEQCSRLPETVELNEED